MPLSTPAPRKPFHNRSIDLNGYLRDDGMWDIEGHLVDTKAYDFHNEWRGDMPAGTPIHDMWLRLTVDDHYTIQGIEAVTDSSPYSICPDITDQFQKLVGLSIVRGFNRKVREVLGGTQGCVHLVELVGTMATVAFQTIRPNLKESTAEGEKPPKPKSGFRPMVLNTCHAWDDTGEVVKRWFPDYYKGEDKIEDAENAEQAKAE